MATRVIEWYVNATRGDVTVRLPALGEVEAQGMVGHLIQFGWDATVDPPWPRCERCTQKHSPHPHEAEGCFHCAAMCRPNEAEPVEPGPTS